MEIGLLAVLGLVLVLPFLIKLVEHNLEYFLFIMGLLAALIAGSLNLGLAKEIMSNSLLYLITIAVLVAGLVFHLAQQNIKNAFDRLMVSIPIEVLVFVLIVLVGLVSSLITAIIASLVLVEAISALPLRRPDKTRITVISCFSIGLGAVLTPIGEPLSTIVVSKLGTDFWYLFRETGPFILPVILLLGIGGAVYAGKRYRKERQERLTEGEQEEIIPAGLPEEENPESLKDVFVRAFKIFVFVIALELLGAGFKPLIDKYLVNLSYMILYWVNMVSSILDNATLAAAEISPALSSRQIQAILLGLLTSGGMLIPGNIPNIISAGKLKIKSREWAATGVPLGLGILAVYFAVLVLL